MPSMPGGSGPGRIAAEAARRQIALLDTAVLFPLVLRDTLLDLALARLYVARWSETILEELRRNLVKRGRSIEAEAARLVASMNRVFPGAPVRGYESRIPDMTNHPKDRHVLAAAIQAKATVIVTTNLRDFRASALTPHGLVARSPDRFLAPFAAVGADQVAQILAAQAAGYRTPAMSFDALLDRLALHAPTFVQRLREQSAASSGQGG